MRIGFIKLVGYIGIYNGLGLKEISIDFSKCKNRKVVIKGSNASGKTTLRKALHIMPDNNSNLINGMECRKELVLIHGINIYNIQIIHPINTKGERATTKAYIQKLIDDKFVELNQNGNIGTYKDILYDELAIDPNFILLSQLSIQNNGLASLKPSERKKFTTALINTTSSYNDMYKAFSKKSATYKSMRNSIISKINNLGNKDKLLVTLTDIDNRITYLTQERDNINMSISKKKTQIEVLDIDNRIQDKFKEISEQLSIVNKNIDKNNRDLENSLKKINSNIDKDSLVKFHESLLNNQQENEMIIKVNESKIDSLLIDRENDGKRLQELNGKLQSLDSTNMNKRKLLNEINDSNRRIEHYSVSLKNMRIKNVYDISKEEFILALDVIKDIQEIVGVVKDTYDYNTLVSSIEYIRGNISIRTDFSELDNIDERIDELKHNLLSYKEMVNIVSILDNRPNECTIDSCPLIKDALEIYKMNPLDNYNKTEIELNELYTLKDNLTKEKDMSMLIILCSKSIETIIRNIDRNTNIIRKLILDESFMNSDRVLDLITNSDIFEEVSLIYKYLDVANTIDLYKSETKKIVELQNALSIIEQKEDIVNDIIEQIKYVQDKLDKATKDIDIMNREIIKSKNVLSGIKSAILEVEYIESIYKDMDTNMKRKEDLLLEYQYIKDSIKSIKELIDRIDKLSNNLTMIDKELKPLSTDRDKVMYSLNMIDEYHKELDEYNKKYELIETLKRYSSPTSGIQTIFINLYMNKTLSLANQLLQLMFNGKYVLYPFIINEHEFRIPCLGSGIMNDDISSMSTSETCMISMIISFAMLQQASTDYNILSLDEIDAGLDTNNRLTFIYVLEELIKIMNVEQCFLISHNNELNLNDCDVILLRIDEQYYNISGNVIYNYQP